MSIFLDRVSRILDQKETHILMGDFNVDAVDHEGLWKYFRKL